MESFQMNSNKFLAWLNDTAIEDGPDENLESYLNNDNFIPQAENLKVIDHMEIPETADLTYNLLNNCKKDYNDQQFSDIHYIGKDGNVSRCGDAIKDIFIKTLEFEDLNKLLISVVELKIGGESIIKGTVLLLNLFKSFIKKNTIYEKDDALKIELAITDVFSYKVIDLIRYVYHLTTLKMIEEIDMSYQFGVNFGYYSTEFRRNCAMNPLDVLLIQSTNKKIIVDSDFNTINIEFKPFTCFIAIWYIVDTSYYTENQSLMPELLNIKIIMGKYSKNIDLKLIKKYNNRKYSCYLIPVNNLSVEELQNIIINKNFDLNNYKNIYKKVFSNIGKAIIELQWCNYQPGSELIVEAISINLARYSSGMFGCHYN